MVVIKGNDFENVNKRQLHFDIGATNFNLEDDESSDYLNMQGDGDINPQVDTTLSNGILDVNIDMKKELEFDTDISQGKYNAHIGNKDLVTDIQEEIGVGKITMNFKKLKINKMDIKVDIGSATIDLAEESIPADKMNIDVGVGSAEIRIPKATGVKINYHVGIGTLKVGNIKLNSSNTYISPNYDSFLKKIEIDVRVGTGSVTIDGV